MKKFILILIGLLAFVSSGACAQNADMSWCENAPDKYLPTTTKEIINRTSPCNQGGEAFMDFIPKFRTNAQFRKSRVRFSDDMSKMTFEYFDNYSLFKAHKKNTKCDQSFGTWFNVSDNEVCFIYQDVLPCSEAGGGTVMARFQRMDGKWYMTAIMAAG